MHPALEIQLVRDNLSLAWTLWQSTNNGLITPLHLLPEENPVRLPDRRPTPAPNTLLRRMGNQLRASFGFSALQTQQSLDRVYSYSPLAEPHAGLKAARCSIYLLTLSLGQGMLSPVWRCPPEYRLSFAIPSIAYALDVTDLDGAPLGWEQFGGLGKYLDLLDYCESWLKDWVPGSAVTVSQPSAVQTDSPFPQEVIQSAGVPLAQEVIQPAGLPLAQTAATPSPQPAARPAAPVAKGGGPASRTRRAPDSVTDFVRSECFLAPEALCPAGALFLAYQDWCQETVREPTSQRGFGLGLTKMGFQRRRRGQGYHWWQGIGLPTSG